MSGGTHPLGEASKDGFPYEEHFVVPLGVDGKKDFPSVPPSVPPSVQVSPPVGEERGIKLLNTLAVIIDDLGYNVPVSKAIFALPADLTLAILPGGRYSQKLAEQGHVAGREILLHQPMEPWRYPKVNPGPGALFVDMDSASIQRVLKDNIKLFPKAVGVNNHMGSRFTNDPKAMDAVMAVLRDKQLFFIDSRTSGTSVGMERALVGHVPTASRNVFVDNVQNVEVILQKLLELERRARRVGNAIGIGHPYPETLIALRRWLPTLQARGLRLVRVSRFLRPVLSRKNDSDMRAIDGNDREITGGGSRAVRGNNSNEISGNGIDLHGNRSKGGVLSKADSGE